MDNTVAVSTPYGSAALPALLDGYSWRVAASKGPNSLAVVHLEAHRDAGYPDKKAVPSTPAARADATVALASIRDAAARLAYINGASVEGAPIGPRPDFTPDRISKLGADEVFVFGSNTFGAHYSGAGADAVKRFGARMGTASAFTSEQSFAIRTMGTFAQLEEDVLLLRSVALTWPRKTFYVTKIGLGIAGWRLDEIAPLFSDAPSNVVLPREFAEWTGPTDPEPSDLEAVRRRFVAENRKVRDLASGARLAEESAAATWAAYIDLLVRREGFDPDRMSLYATSTWNCPGIPEGICVYDTTTDPDRDCCIFCHEPLERK